MRLDKYMKVSRIIKRRTVAKEVCDAGRINVNGRPAKAGTDIKVGDILNITYGRNKLEVEVLRLAETVRTDEADSLYRIIEKVFMQEDDLRSKELIVP